MKKIIAACVFVITFGVVTYALNPDFTPLKQALTSVLDTKVSQENQELKKQVINLTQQAAKADLLEKENRELQTLLDTDFSKKYTKTYANVTSLSIADEIFLSIDRGAQSGIKTGDVAVFGKALVGRVVRVFDTHAHILPLSAPEVCAGAMVSDSGALGYTESSRQDFFENTVALTLFGAQDFAAAGDDILTSGLGTAFPKGLLIGTVIEATKKDENAKVRTTTDIFSLHTVCILSEVG